MLTNMQNLMFIYWLNKSFMTSITLKYLFVSTCIFTTSLISAQTWVRFSPNNQPFEVYVPGEMKSGEKKLLTDVGELHAITWLYNSDGNDPNYLYSVSYVDYPEGTFHSDSIDLISEFFEISLQTHIKGLKGQLVYKSDTPYLSYPGLLYRASYNDNKAIVKSRLILSGDRFYALQVYTVSEKSLNPEMDKFLSSFEIKTKVK